MDTLPNPLDLTEAQGFQMKGPAQPVDKDKIVTLDDKEFVTARDLVGQSKGRAVDWKLLDHLEYARQKNFPFVKANEFPGGEVAICGSGPSIGRLDQIKQIRRLQRKGVTIHAINRCADFLATKGIFCNSASLLDPIPHVANYITPRSDTDYFIGFQCAPETFDVFDKPDLQKFVWFCRTTKAIDSQLTPKELAFAVPSRTSTNGLRSVLLNYMRGFRRFHFFGFDSCYETFMDDTGREQIKLSADGKGKLHAHAKPETIHDIRTTKVCEFTDDNRGVAYEKEYFTNSSMLAQADEFIQLVEDIAGGIRAGLMDQVFFHVHGDGLIPDIACSVKFPLHVDHTRHRKRGMPALRLLNAPSGGVKPFQVVKIMDDPEIIAAMVAGFSKGNNASA